MEVFEEDNINQIIIEERNREIQEIEREIIDLHEISRSLSLLLGEQGEELDKGLTKLDESVEHTESAKQSLEKSLLYDENGKRLRELSILASGVTLGALGFLGGPIVGVITLLSGASVSTGLVIASRFRNI